MKSGTHRDLLFWSGSCWFCMQKPQVGSIHLQRLVILVLKALFCMHKTTGESWNPYSLFILVQIMLFCIHKTTGEVWYTKRLVLWSKSRCFACKNHRWGLGPIEPSYSGANHAEVNAQNDRSCLGPIETCYSGPEVAVLLEKTTGGVWDTQTLVILMLGTLFCMQKITGEVWDP